MRFYGILLLGFFGVARLSQAATEVELNINLLQHEQTDTEVDSKDSSDYTSKETSTITTAPNFDIDIYADTFILGFNYEAGSDEKSGGVQGLYRITPEIAAGLMLNHEKISKTETTKSEGEDEEETKTHSDTLNGGPMIGYRLKTDASTITGALGLSTISQRSKDEDGVNTKTTGWLMAMKLGYSHALTERVRIGPEINYFLGLGIKSKTTVGETTIKSDLDSSTVDLILAKLTVDL